MEKEIKELLESINNDKALMASFEEAARMGGPVNITGLCEQQKGYLIAALSYRFNKKPVVVVSDVTRAKTLTGGLAPFMGGDIPVLKPAELSVVSAVASSHENESERTGVTLKIMKGEFDAALICAPALLNKMPDPSSIQKKSIKLVLGKNYDPVKLVADLAQMGYERVGMVSQQGEFAARGDVVDVFSPDAHMPIRLSFFDDEIDQIKSFDPDNQRSTDSFNKITICRAREVILDKKARGQAADKILKAAAEDINKMNAESAKAAAELLSRTAHADSDRSRLG